MQRFLKTIQTLSCWYSLESSRRALSDEYPFARVSVILLGFLHYFVLVELASSPVPLEIVVCIHDTLDNNFWDWEWFNIIFEGEMNVNLNLTFGFGFIFWTRDFFVCEIFQNIICTTSASCRMHGREVLYKGIWFQCELDKINLFFT